MWAKIKAHLWAIAGNSRTILVGYGLEFAGYLDEAKYLDWTSWFGAERGGKLVMVLGGVVIGLRLITTAAVSWQALIDKAPKDV